MYDTEKENIPKHLFLKFEANHYFFRNAEANKIYNRFVYYCSIYFPLLKSEEIVDKF